jgi:glycerophosphoryl diester phosphodiesterase
MDTVKIEKKQVSMVAHRGLSGIERENTCPAFVAAGNRSYYGIETDVHVTRDGQFVIIHDESTGRVSDGACHVNVEEADYEAVRELVLPDRDGSRLRQDIRVPLLREYISICKKYNKRCILEVKNTFKQDDLSRMVEEIRALGYLEGVTFISFSRENCLNLRAMLPTAEVQFLCDKVNEEIIAMLVEHRLDLDIYYPSLDAALVTRLHALGIKVNCWTCDNKEHGEALVAMGVDMITSNILE